MKPRIKVVVEFSNNAKKIKKKYYLIDEIVNKIISGAILNIRLQHPDFSETFIATSIILGKEK